MKTINNNEVVGIVLAGGRSSRMGQNKALLKYKNKTFLDIAISNLQKLGLKNIYVSGNYKNYNSIADNTPHKGPALAISNIINSLPYSNFLFTPVDMPLLNTGVLKHALSFKSGAYFTKQYLPAFIVCNTKIKPETSVKSLLSTLKIKEITVPKEFENTMVNINTKEQWQEHLNNEHKI